MLIAVRNCISNLEPSFKEIHEKVEGIPKSASNWAPSLKNLGSEERLGIFLGYQQW